MVVLSFRTLFEWNGCSAATIPDAQFGEDVHDPTQRLDSDSSLKVHGYSCANFAALTGSHSRFAYKGPGDALWKINEVTSETEESAICNHGVRTYRSDGFENIRVASSSDDLECCPWKPGCNPRCLARQPIGSTVHLSLHFMSQSSRGRQSKGQTPGAPSALSLSAEYAE